MAARILLSTTVVWPQPARLAGAFAACGATVEALAPRRHPVAESKSLSRLHPYRALQALNGLREAIDEAAPDLILPCDDRATLQLVTLAREDARYAELAARSIGPIESYQAIFSRNAFLNLAAALGIKVPPTRQAGTEVELKAALHATGLPAVIKTDESWGGDGIFIARTLDEALSIFRHLALAPSRLRSLVRAAKRQDAHFLLNAADPRASAISVQRHVEGTQATCAFAAWKGQVLASLHMDVLETVSPFGPATVLKRSLSSEMEEAAHAIAERFDLSGFHGLDFIRDPSGRLHLIEINPRATQICHLALGAGQDLPAALMGALTGRPIEARAPVTLSQTIALFPQSTQLGAHLAGAYHDIPADDPKLLHALSALRKAQTSDGLLQNA